MTRDEVVQVLELARKAWSLPADTRPGIGALADSVLHQLAQLSLLDAPPNHVLGDRPPAAAPRARTTDPDTSRRAYLDNLPRARSQRRRIMEALCPPDGTALLRFDTPRATADALADQLALPLNSVSTRLSELLAGGWVYANGTQPTHTGTPATAYSITTRGRVALQERSNIE